MISTRQGLIDYTLRYLGAPLLEINVDESQIEDRIDEALEYFRLYHYDGIEKVYLKHKITASKLEIAETNARDFVISKKWNHRDVFSYMRAHQYSLMAHALRSATHSYYCRLIRELRMDLIPVLPHFS